MREKPGVRPLSTRGLKFFSLATGTRKKVAYNGNMNNVL